MYFFKVLKIFFAIVLSALALVPTSMGLPAGIGSPTVEFDAENLTGDVTNGASGYLYGIAEDGVPSHNMIESLDVSSVSAKTQCGLQHPIGEVGDVADSLTENDKCDYIVVYLQDMFSTWYYEDATITEMKKDGTYDWKKFLIDEYFPRIEESVNSMKNSSYEDKLVYCIFNECDNGVWFGEWIQDGDNGWNAFNETGRKNFNEAWKMTYDFVKTLVPDALIGGPGNYEYNSSKTEDFLSFTSKNNCTPEVIIYHELQDRSVYDWEANVEDLKRIEKKYGIDTDTPIIITEYGRMQDNSNPNTMLKYIVRCENSKVYANQAYWLLANNLCSTTADYNTPNSAWWVYRWYTSMQGKTMKSEIKDILHSDLGKALKEKREVRYQQFMALGTISDNKDKLDILVSGADYSSRVLIKNLKNTQLFGKNVKIEITAVTFQGILGKVYEPEVVKIYTRKLGRSLSIPLETNSNTAYHITVTEAQNKVKFENDNLFKRYEAEDGLLLGNAYTYDSAYATTGKLQGMVGGIENDGDGAEIPIDINETGKYLVRLIYGNSNDGKTSNDRTFSNVNFTLDGKTEILSFENTIRSEITNTYDLLLDLEKGTHNLTFTHNKGTIVLDSILVKKYEESDTIYSEKDDDRLNGYLTISPEDGYYLVKTKENSALNIDGAYAASNENGESIVYLRRGLNYIESPAEIKVFKTDKRGKTITLLPDDAILYESAEIKHNDKLSIDYITGISCESGYVQFKINAPKAGRYKMTVLYSNNRENGVHSYNVDLVEDFITLGVNGEKQMNFYTRNTYSSDTYTTVTVNVDLVEGENVIEISNDGENKFNGNTTYAPDIAKITINSTEAD